MIVKKGFWNRWEQANEIEKQKIVGELPILKDINCPLFSNSIINSYFEDLYLFMKKKYENSDGESDQPER